MGNEENEEEIENPKFETPSGEANIITAEASYIHALDDRPRQRSIKLINTIDESQVHVLVDTGSSHNFLCSTIAEKLSLPLRAISHFRVYVVNDASLICSHMSPHTYLVLQGNCFAIDLHILLIHGPAIILGMDWLQSLRRITHNYIDMTMDFIVNDCPIQLQGVSPQPRHISTHSLATLLSISTQHDIYEVLSIQPANDQNSVRETVEFPQDIPVSIRLTLERHRVVFSIPEGILPSRAFDHRIHLLPNTKPINVRPLPLPLLPKE